MLTHYNLLIVDDHPIIADAYKNILQFNGVIGSEVSIETVLNIPDAISNLRKWNNIAHYDLILLDINLPASEEYNLNSGADLGEYIRRNYPQVSILVITSYTDPLRLFDILARLNPEGFLLKTDIATSDLVYAVKNILKGNHFYSETINNLLSKRALDNHVVDQIDVKILSELSNGSKMKELTQMIPLTKSGIEKRKRTLKMKLCRNNGSDRELVLTAKEKGFI